MILQYLIQIIYYENNRFQFIGKKLSTKSQLVENIINGNLSNWTQDRNNEFI